MTPQDAIAAALTKYWGWDLQSLVLDAAEEIIDNLPDGWVLVNAETLAAAFSMASGFPMTEGYRSWAEAVIATLRGDTDDGETPVRMIPEVDATHGYTCGTCSWGRDGKQDRTYWDYLDHRVETGHDPVVAGPALRGDTDA